MHKSKAIQISDSIQLIVVSNNNKEFVEIWCDHDCVEVTIDELPKLIEGLTQLTEK